ncbi:hypothetical protein KBZ18_07740 [Synechococcus sp. Cruz-9H2]|uniref:hypothetical protein n=1 Tax=unclassified Synechococcus TaxID=2626047 RepID=UPI0020CC515E|nr:MULTISPECIES: hypothetical protein [unclassified Synechococcus]MCP9819383.1 hypothetical protein [Synechococcus sp. Cruz-9H2]MCP9843176.1 hypothetical protein [Synechococcus sp. Edmonson 11F2]MCP9854921.1 hypothetical protein [Synechococcus sp. Cruz-9C9]MCP9862608.1 hypothetical protein [Synechococcus sp. Cruz-7E5]MCP9870293.1 hypothetical protein [Synechococcus sp. Cruz-7B9]
MNSSDFDQRFDAGESVLEALDIGGARRREYLEQVRQVDISWVDDRRRDRLQVGSLLQSLARNVATEVSQAVLAVDASGADGASENPQGFLLAVARPDVHPSGGTGLSVGGLHLVVDR